MDRVVLVKRPYYVTLLHTLVVVGGVVVVRLAVVF